MARRIGEDADLMVWCVPADTRQPHRLHTQSALMLQSKHAQNIFLATDKLNHIGRQRKIFFLKISSKIFSKIIYYPRHAYRNKNINHTITLYTTN